MSVSLAERAVACKGWRWMQGMATGSGRVCVSGSDPEDLEDGERQLVRWTRGHWKCTDYEDPGDTLPDLDDPATLGCFEHGLLPSAWDDPWFAIVADSDGRWRCTGSRDYHGLYGYESKGDALVAALEAAP